ncbi:MAG: carboxypeptidase regulatory-like domain-containing protein [Thermoleophilia bacterium]|nr:carboxypeptidase regulatory-like domain-containing protein [Thermoleophilia bacterium]
MGKVMVIDITKCNGCHNCQIACKDEHCGNDWSPIAKPQPLTGQFWTRVIDRVRGQVPKVKVTYEHSICQHCDEAPCIKACPEGAIYKRPDGIVIIDPELCKGSHNCVEACPYPGVIFFNEDLFISQKCTFCAHLLDQGWKETRCSEACPTGAITVGEEDDLAELIAKAEVLKAELGTKPRVYYIGLPRLFVAGTVYDPEADEVVEGATVSVSLVSEDGGGGAARAGAPGGAAPTATGSPERVVATATTDEFGDFWIDGLDRGVYVARIEKEGLRPLEIGPFVLDKDLNLGDIAMHCAWETGAMRAIVNIMPGNAATAAGWRAREVKVQGEKATIGDILRAVYLKDGKTSLFELIATEEGLKPDFAVFISGELVRGKVDWSRPVQDSEQIHVCDWPMRDA